MNPGRIIAGLTFILIGALLVLDRMEVIESGEVAWSLWPLLIVALGISMYAGQQTTQTAAMIVTGVGVLLLIVNVDILPGDFWDWFWPIVLIGAGIWIISRRYRPDEPGGTDATNERAVSTSILGSSDFENRSTAFQGGSLTAILGSVKLNLRRARLAPEGARMDVTAVMGDAEVYVPDDWAVQVNASPILGDVKDETRSRPFEPGEPVFTIQATSIMADVKIKRAD